MNEPDRDDAAARRPGAPIAAPFQVRAPEPRPSRFRGLLSGERFSSCDTELEMAVEDRTGGELSREVAWSAAGRERPVFVEVRAWLRPAARAPATAGGAWRLEIHELLRSGPGPEACTDELAIGEIRAFGAGWTLDVVAAGVSLGRAGSDDVRFRAVEPVRTEGAIELRTVDVAGRLLTLRMTASACRDPATGARAPYAATVEIAGERLEGCAFDRGGFSYAAELPASGTPEWLVTLSLEADGSAQLATEFTDGSPPVVESGNWYAETDQLAIQLLSVASPEGPQPIDETLQFRITETGVEALGEFGFGESGWVLVLH